jgi:hypothetical protein
MFQLEHDRETTTLSLTISSRYLAGCRQLAYLQHTSLIVVTVSGGSGVDLSAVLQARGGHNSSNMTNTRHNPMLIPWLGEVVGGHHPPAKPRIDPGTP